MSFPLHYLLFLILCVSPNACSSRRLDLLSKELKNELRVTKDILTQDEVPEKIVNVLKHRRRFIFEELQPESIHMDEIRVEKSAEKTEIKGWKMEARSIMEEDDTAEKIKSPKNEGTVEDVVMMDYTQPHRKPPIHNLEP